MSKEHDALAKRLHEELEQTPTLTVAELAEKTGADVQDVIEVIDTYLVEDGKPKRAGRDAEGGGKGGGWPAPEPEPVE